MNPAGRVFGPFEDAALFYIVEVGLTMKLLVTDIDETLSRGMDVTAEVAEACARLRENGWRIMLATGRILATARSHILGTGSDLPAIVYDGGRIMDPVTSKALYEVPLDPALALEIVQAGWEHPVELQIIGDERGYCRFSDVLTRSFFRESGVPVDDSLQSPSVPSEVFRVIFHGIPGCIRTLRRDLKAQFDGRAEVVLAGENFLDVLPRGVSKGSALEAWLTTLPEPPEIIVAAGDHHNDLEMLASAHLAVAPEDAAEEILRLAHVIMPSADRHGFSFLADHLLSEEKIRSECGAAIVL